MIRGFYFREHDTMHDSLINDYFNYNEEYDFYYNEYGALVYEGPFDMEEFLKLWWVKELLALGYKFGYGVSTPAKRMRGTKKAIYCTNYEEILEKYKKDNKIVTKKLSK